MNSSAGKLDRARIAKDWQARGFSCDLWVDPHPRPHLPHRPQHRRHYGKVAVRV